MRKINKLIVHCSATPEGKDIKTETIRDWHVSGNHWKDIGYHYVIELDGSIHKGRDESVIGAHCSGQNANSIGICYIGGVDKSFFEPVLSKKKKVIGYIFVTKSILPKHSFQDSNYGTMRQCNACGHINMEIKEPEYWYRQKTISKMGLKKLKDVNLTYEFYSDYQQKIISKKAARIILRHVKYAELFPVYLRR